MLVGSEICRILPAGGSGSAGKLRSANQIPVLRFRDLRFCCQKSSCARRFPIFSPHFRNMRPCKACSSYISSIRDNIQLLRKRQRAVAGKPNNDPSLSPPHVESTATVSLRTSYRNVKGPNKATIGDVAVRPHFPSK